jgi:predicted 3-demethylubiquinone-9 3-methyltransferase (glyoxalase superfamily)
MRASDRHGFPLRVRAPQWSVLSLGNLSRCIPSGKTGDVLLVEFRLMGQPFTGLNGGPQFQFNEAISFQIPVETQAEADRFADALSAVPEAEQCGWVKDRFGVSWQIFPRQLIKLIGDADRARAKRAFDAMSQMKRIDIAAIERAADS